MVCKYKIVRIHKLFGTEEEEDVLGPVLGALVRWVEVSKYKVGKQFIRAQACPDATQVQLVQSRYGKNQALASAPLLRSSDSVRLLGYCADAARVGLTLIKGSKAQLA